MTDELKENLIKALNYKYFYNDQECNVKDVNFFRNQVCVEYEYLDESGKLSIHTVCFE